MRTDHIAFLISCLCTGAASAQGTSLCMFASDNAVYDNGISMGGPNLLLGIKLQAPATLAITRLEVWTGERSGVNTLGIWSHNAATNMPLQSLTIGQWNMGMVNGWQGATVPAVLVPAATDFWLVWGPQNSAQASVGIRGPNAPGAQFYRGSFDGGQSWNGGATGWKDDLWKFRIRCGGSPGGYEVFGAGCRSSTRGVPVLGFNDIPTLGQGMEVNLTQAPASVVGLLAIGQSATTWLGTPLPLDLTPLGAPTCSILCSAFDFIIVQASATGSAGVALTVPADNSLVGVKLFNQWWLVDPAANSLGFSFSNGGRGTIGN